MCSLLTVNSVRVNGGFFLNDVAWTALSYCIGIWKGGKRRLSSESRQNLKMSSGLQYYVTLGESTAGLRVAFILCALNHALPLEAVR